MSETPQVPGFPGVPEPTGQPNGRTPSEVRAQAHWGTQMGLGNQLLDLVKQFSIIPSPVPQEMGVFAVSINGEPKLLMVFMTPVGPAYYYFDPENALEFATNVAVCAKQMTTGIHLPGGFNPLN